MGDHDGRVAVITGGSQGIGRASALCLASQGAAVVVHGESIDLAELVVEEIERGGGRACAIAGPIQDTRTSEAMVELSMRRYGRVDSVVTSAGIQRYGDVRETDEKTWHEVLDVNVTGVFLALHHLVPEVRRSESGSVVIVSSVQALASQSQVVAYSASKGALSAMTRALAVDEAAHGVRVNSVSPGSVDTPMLRRSAAMLSNGTEAAVEQTLRGWGSAHPMGRVARPAEVGEVVAFLAGPRASFITGTDVRVDGGLTARLAASLSPTVGDDAPS